MTHTGIGLGSNLGDRRDHLLQAARAIQALPVTDILQASSIWETPPWGKTDQPAFLNACLLVETSLTPNALLSLILKIEQDMGREREEKWGPRLIDIDLLFMEDHHVVTDDLILPHPHISERAFVLAPLKEIAPFQQIGTRSVLKLADEINFDGLVKLGPFPPL